MFVGRFITGRGRLDMMGDHPKKFTSVYVNGFGGALDEDKLKDVFAACGPIISCKVITDDNGKSRGCGFVSFEEHKAAQKAVDELNSTEIDGHTIFVGRAENLKERCEHVKKERYEHVKKERYEHVKKERYEHVKQERNNRCQGVNLYVKNLDETIDDEKLINEFSAFGTITSAKVMCENGRSKGFGFVCFSLPEEATKAMAHMKGRVLVSKPMYVALAQRKDERRRPKDEATAQLYTQYIQRISSIRMSPPYVEWTQREDERKELIIEYIRRMSSMRMTAPGGQITPQKSNNNTDGAQLFYPSTIWQVRPQNPHWPQATIRASVQQAGDNNQRLMNAPSKQNVALHITTLYDLPLEMMDVILQKSYLYRIFNSPTKQRNGEVIKDLISVDVCFNRRINKQRFKKTIWRYLKGEMSST